MPALNVLGWWSSMKASMASSGRHRSLSARSVAIALCLTLQGAVTHCLGLDQVLCTVTAAEAVQLLVFGTHPFSVQGVVLHCASPREVLSPTALVLLTAQASQLVVFVTFQFPVQSAALHCASPYEVSSPTALVLPTHSC